MARRVIYCLYIETDDMRRSARTIVVPLSDVVRVTWWRTVCRLMDFTSWRMRGEHDTSVPRRWAQTRNVQASMRARFLPATPAKPIEEADNE